MSDDYQVHNIYRYTRKSYKQSRNYSRDCAFENSQDDVDQAENAGENVAFELLDHSPRSDGYGVVSSCLYDLPEGDMVMANLLRTKCPVITLAQQQLLRVLDETNHALSRIPEERCSALIRCLCRYKKSRLCLLKVGLTLAVFCTGLLLGTVTCGNYLGEKNNLIVDCMDNYFISDSYTSIEDTFQCTT